MAARRIVVISAGLSTPSSTRLLADRLAAASVAALGDRFDASPASRYAVFGISTRLRATVAA